MWAYLRFLYLYLIFQTILVTLAWYSNHKSHQLHPSSFIVHYQITVTNPLLNVMNRKLRHQPRGKANWTLQNPGLSAYSSPFSSLVARTASISTFSRRRWSLFYYSLLKHGTAIQPMKYLQFTLFECSDLNEPSWSYVVLINIMIYFIYRHYILLGHVLGPKDEENTVTRTEIIVQNHSSISSSFRNKMEATVNKMATSWMWCAGFMEDCFIPVQHRIIPQTSLWIRTWF